jgi:hypothetical protein
MSGTLRVDAIESHLELLCILLHCFLDTLLEIAVYSVPAIGLFGQIVFVPSWYIPFNEIKPEFGILLHDMRRKQFERSLTVTQAFERQQIDPTICKQELPLTSFSGLSILRRNGRASG